MTDSPRPQRRPVAWFLLSLGGVLVFQALLGFWGGLRYSVRGIRAAGRVVEFHSAASRSASILGQVEVTLPGAAPSLQSVSDPTHSREWEVGGTVPLLCIPTGQGEPDCVVDSYSARFFGPTVVLLLGTGLVAWFAYSLRRPPAGAPGVPASHHSSPPPSRKRARGKNELLERISEADPSFIPPKTLGEVGVRGAAFLALQGLLRFETLLAVALLAAASMFLSIAWHWGLPHSAAYRAFTSHTEGAIVESWVAVEIDLPTIRIPSNWRASAKATPCAVVEFGAEWGAPLRRAFCGNRLPFNDSYALEPLHQMAPGVPFGWPRDARGFVVPEIRMDPKAVEWLRTHEPDHFMHKEWPAPTALDWLRLEFDHPVDAAVTGWTTRLPPVPLSFDPQRPAGAVPTGYVHTETTEYGNPIALLVGAALGLPVWFAGISLLPLLSGLSTLSRRGVGVALLLTVPWWADHFPTAVAYFSREGGGVLQDMMNDLDPLGRFAATDPGDALLAGGVRLSFPWAKSIYADTLGPFRFEPPAAPLPSATAALEALRGAVTVEARSLDGPTRRQLFETLTRDDRRDLREARTLFLPAAQETVADPHADTDLRRAAQRLLD
jgi:hypothetical protein